MAAASISATLGQETITLEIERIDDLWPLVEIRFLSVEGTVYQLQRSLDATVWELEDTITGSGDVEYFEVFADEEPQAFFRIANLPVVPIPNMVLIQPGSFVMGSPQDEEGRYLDKEEPLTEVTLTRGFWIGAYEVTQEEFEEIMGYNRSIFDTDPNRPVDSASWFEALDYCEELTLREREAGHLPEGYEYRLPTEAEWAYAARAGTTTRFSYGDDPGYERLEDYAWYKGNSRRLSHPVGQKLPNPWGLYDMHGNLFEWCMNWFGQLPGGQVVDPIGPDDGYDRSLRGGYWDSQPSFCRSAIRVHFPPDEKISFIGFRNVLAETREEL